MINACGRRYAQHGCGFAKWGPDEGLTGVAVAVVAAGGVGGISGMGEWLFLQAPHVPAANTGMQRDDDGAPHPSAICTP